MPFPSRAALGDRAVAPEIAESRRRLVAEGTGIAISIFAFGVVYGLAARNAGFSLVEALAASCFVLAGASQFAAVGLVAAGVPWIAIVTLTFLLNLRHFLYAATLAPWVQERPRVERAVMAHVLTDEVFALALGHFRRIGRFDAPGYWLASFFLLPFWIGATVIGHLGGELLPDPRVLGIDLVFPAAMAGLGVALVKTRPEALSAVVAAVVAVVIALVSQSAIGIVTGAIVGPLAGLALEARRSRSRAVART